MVSAFLQEVSRTRLPVKVEPVRATIATGISFSGILKNVLVRLRGVKGIAIRQVTVKSYFFGPSVTVTGLLTGGDLLRALRGKRLGDLVLVPSNMLKEDEAVFLDGMSLDQLQRELRVRIVAVDSFRSLLAALKNERRTSR
jgi:NifB/MoaA-like Fe-S oxidoreductase